MKSAKKSKHISLTKQSMDIVAGSIALDLQSPTTVVNLKNQAQLAPKDDSAGQSIVAAKLRLSQDMDKEQRMHSSMKKQKTDM